jgi:hypothetical protein
VNKFPEFKVWVRGREYIVDADVEGPDPSVGLFSRYIIVATLTDVETGTVIECGDAADGYFELTDGESEDIDKAYWDIVYFEESLPYYSYGENYDHI